MFKYAYRIKTTLLESLWCKKNPLRARFRHNLLEGLSYSTNCLLRLFGNQKESLGLIIIQYMLKYSFRTKTTLLEPFRSRKRLVKSQIS